MNTSHTKPSPLSLIASSIPEELRAGSYFVCWRYVWRDGKDGKPGKWTKVPYNVVSGAPADSTNPKTWCDFETAYGAYQAGRYDGVGRVFTADGGYVGIDVDDCLWGDGSLSDFARSIVDRLPGMYWERSPSGRGVHGFGRGSLPEGARSKHTKKGYEQYDQDRYFTLTGHIWDGHTQLDGDISLIVAAIGQEVFHEPQENTGSGYEHTEPSASEMEIVRRCEAFANGEKFRRLMRGDTSGYASDSEADAALLMMILFANGGDIDQAVSIARTSGLARDKWDTMRGNEPLIVYEAKRARSKIKEFYEPKKQRPSFEHSNNSNNSNDSPEPAEPGAPYPTDCLPAALRQLVEEGRDTLGIPAEFTGPAGVATIAGAIGNALEVEIKRGWRERPNVWLGIVGAPGTTKSPAIELASWPLSEIQKDLRDKWRDALAAWNETPKDQRGPAPQLEIVEVTDSTVEGLARALEHSRGVLSKADELTSWLSGHNRYRGKNASERGEHLKLWAGGNLVAVRSTRLPLIIDKPAVALIGGIQPARLAALGSDQPGVFVDDGMLDRFLIAWPDARPARWTDDEMSRETMAAWVRIVRSLRRWKPIGTDAEGERDIVRLTDPARALWRQWHDSNVDSIETAHGLTRGWASKAPRHLLRIALILHAGNNPDEPKYDITAETLEAAIEITEWHRQQHGRMLSALRLGAASPAAGLPGRIVRILRIAGGWVSRADLIRALGNVKADALTNALERLIADDTVTKRTAATATKPREEYALASNNSNYSNYSTKPGADAGEKFEKFESSNGTHNQNGRETGRWGCECGAKNDPTTWPDWCPRCGLARTTSDLARSEAA